MVKRVEPNRNVYVGHRYVPKIMGEWDKTIQYEGLSIVLNEGHSYTSKGYVPVGIDIKNKEFWALTGNYNAQVEHYRMDVERLSDDIDDLSIYVDGEIIDLKAFVNDNMTQFENEMNVKHNTLTTNVNNNISDFKSEVNTNMSDLETGVNNDISDFKSEVNTNMSDLETGVNNDISDFKSEVNTNMSDLETDVNTNINGFKSDVNNNINNFKNEVNDVNTEQDKKIRDISVTPLMFGAKGDGVSDDTQALQDTIDHCIEEGLILHSHPDKVYKTNGNIISGYLNMTGFIKLKALTNNQEHVLRIESKINSNCELIIDGDNKAKHGIIGTKFGRSKFYKTEVERCKVWGMIYLPSGNNNFIQHDYFRAHLNGHNEEYTMTKVSQTNNVLTSITGYGTYELSGNIDNIYKENNVTYFLNYNDEAYKIKSITNNIIEVYNLNAGNVGGQINAKIYSGGGLNIPKHGDNGVGSFANADIFSNYGVGVNNSSLYSHNFHNFVAQGNGLGFTCDDYTLGIAFISPYFELNNIDVVVWNYMQGFMTYGIYNIDRFQTLTGRVLGSFKGISLMEYVTSQKGSMVNMGNPKVNPSKITVKPGSIDNVYKSNQSNLEIEINNLERFNIYKNFTSIINVNTVNKLTPFNITITTVNKEDTVHGVETYEHPVRVTGDATIMIYKVRSNWIVKVINDNYFDNINYVPANAGEVAVFNNKVYISVGTESNADWKEIQFVNNEG